VQRLRNLVPMVLMVLVAAGSGGLGMGCSSPEPAANAPPRPAPAPVGPQTFSVSVDATSSSIPLVADQYFPNELQVHPGDSIKFNEVWSGEPHTVSFGSLVDQAATSTALAGPSASPSPVPGLPAFFPRPGRGSDPIPAASQPCFLDTGVPPATAACPRVDQPALSGGQAFYSSGWLPPTSTFTVALSPTINPGTYTFRCLVHPNMTGKIHVVPPAQTIPGPAQVTAAGTAQVAAVVTALTPAVQDAALVTTTNVAGITTGDGVTATLAATFGPPEVDTGVSQTVAFSVYGTHAIAVNPPDSAIGLLTKGPDGVVHANSAAVRSAGGESPPLGVQTRPRTVFGGSYGGSGFHNSGLLTSLPPGLLTYTLQFTSPGTYSLRCLVHPAMTATVRVSP
jgi:plastocyanin